MNNDALKLICETDFHDIVMLENQDHVNSRRSISIRGPYIVCGEKNGNGREYLEEVMVPAVDDFVTSMVNTDRAVGEMNHPPTTTVNYDNVCHKITSLEKDGNIWIGTSKILTGTPKGDLLAGLIENKVKVGMSTRGVGKVDDDKIVRKFKLITVDVVHEPSGPNCFMEGILESKDFMIDNHGLIVEMAYANMEKQLSNLSLNSVEKSIRIASAISDFLKNI